MADLGDVAAWSFADLELFGKLLHTLEPDIQEIKKWNGIANGTVNELEASLLKGMPSPFVLATTNSLLLSLIAAGARKEEIVRFSKAKTDKEFARMMKSRTLHPEQVEMQHQLRRRYRVSRPGLTVNYTGLSPFICIIQVLCDSLDQLETHLRNCKKRVNEYVTGKPSFKCVYQCSVMTLC